MSEAKAEILDVFRTVDLTFSCYAFIPLARRVINVYANLCGIQQGRDGSFAMGNVVVGASYDSWTGRTELECVAPSLQEARHVFGGLMAHAGLSVEPLESVGRIVEIYSGW